MEEWFIRELISEVISDYAVPQRHFEDELSPILTIFLEDIINTSGRFIEEINKAGEFKFISKEFPFRFNRSYQHKNVDFLLHNDEYILIVELKTSSNSYYQEPNQKETYLNVKRKIEHEKSAAFLIDDLNEICKHSRDKKQKYLDTYQFLKSSEALSRERAVFNKIHKAVVVFIGPQNLKGEFPESSLVNFISFHDLSRVMLSEFMCSKEKINAWDIIRVNLVDIEELDSLY